MALIKLDPNEAIPYIPRFDRKNFTDPLTVHLKYASAMVYDEWLRKLGRASREVSTDVEKIEVSKAHDKQMFFDHVVKVENFLDGKGNPIESVSEFYDAIDYQLRAEIIDALSNQAKLTEGQRKN